LTVDHAVTAWLISGEQSDPFAWVASLTRRPQWMERAACRGAGADAFVVGRGANGAAMARARAVCATCSVTDECLSFAMADPDLTGIWGVTTGAERRRLRMAATDPPTVTGGHRWVSCRTSGQSCRKVGPLLLARRMGHTKEVMFHSYVLGADDRQVAAADIIEARLIEQGLPLGELLPYTPTKETP